MGSSRSPLFRKIAIVNRGEIARRIQWTCERLGQPYVQLYSDADQGTMFQRSAQESYCIGGSSAKDSYLNVPRIVECLGLTDVDAVHPGYGFLSENAEFAQSVIASGRTFIGPTPATIRKMGSKTSARAAALRVGLPLAPGTDGGLSDEQLVEAAKTIGFPVLIKAVSGGGGRGMRVVEGESELLPSLERAHAEAKKFFSDPSVYIERFFRSPRHIEVQLFGDSHGAVVHLGTRDCSIQRRHQKLVEEAPAPNLSPRLRRALEGAAVKLAQSVSYLGAGTVEFLVDGEEFFFLEMNTRIQVEHPVTELVYGEDLIEWQLRVAAGEALPKQQEQLAAQGHAIEFRVNAENPARNFQPALGLIEAIVGSSAEVLREDRGLSAGDEITPYYDGLIAKLIVYGATREDALEKSASALSHYDVHGIETTLPFHRWLLRFSSFSHRPPSINFIASEFTVEALQMSERSRRVDSTYRDPLSPELNFQEEFAYNSGQLGKISIAVEHLPDKSFLAYAPSGEGRPDELLCRRSNERVTAIAALIREVIEHQPE